MPYLPRPGAWAGLRRLPAALAFLRSIRCSLETSPTMARLLPPGQAPCGTRPCPSAELARQIRRTLKLWACLRPTAPERCALFGWQRAIMSLPQAPGRKNVIERTLEAGLFASRWLMAPFYVGLALTLAVLVVTFGREFVHAVLP